MAAITNVKERLAGVDWQTIARDLDQWGYAQTGCILPRESCRELIRLYDDENRFRSRISMAQFRFGLGEYKYFAEPLPSLVAHIRTEAYPYLSPIANRWMERLGRSDHYPADLADFLTLCAEQGQTKPTPLLLRYETGGYNCLHQDLYGTLAFPLQMTCVLSSLGADYTGGEFLLVEQRPRSQSRGTAIQLRQGEAVIFTTRERPVQGSRGDYRVAMRHGVSRVTSGMRYSLGVIFHNAK
jgi:hypothetical protein